MFRPRTSPLARLCCDMEPPPLLPNRGRCKLCVVVVRVDVRFCWFDRHRIVGALDKVSKQVVYMECESLTVTASRPLVRECPSGASHYDRWAPFCDSSAFSWPLWVAPGAFGYSAPPFLGRVGLFVGLVAKAVEARTCDVEHHTVVVVVSRLLA